MVVPPIFTVPSAFRVMGMGKGNRTVDVGWVMFTFTLVAAAVALLEVALFSKPRVDIVVLATRLFVCVPIPAVP